MSQDDTKTKADRLAAFETVVNEYEAALLRYATRLLGSETAAQDVVQEAFLRLFQNWEGEIKTSTHLSHWLYRVTHNCAVDHLRGEARRCFWETRPIEDGDSLVPPDRGRDFRISEAAEQAVGALRLLPLREQQLVILKVYEEKTYQEISDITGLSVGNVGYLLHYAMKKMAEELKKKRAI